MNVQELFQKAQDLRNNGKIEEAVKIYQQIVGLSIQKDDALMIGKATHMIGVALFQDKRYQEALDYLMDALDQFKRLNNQEMWGAVLRDLGMVNEKLGEIDVAKDYFNNSIYYLKEAGSLGHAGISQVKLGKLYSKMDQKEKAESLIKEGIENIEKSSGRFFESTAYFDLAKLQVEMDKKAEAKTSAEKALEILNKMSNREQFLARRKEIEKFLEL